MKWITDELKKKIRDVYEPRYKHPLSDSEILEIAQTLTSFMESFLKHKWGLNHGIK